MENNKAQRIYVGGLDPSRGLTVELVASRLRAVKDVEITSINDVAINDQGDATCPSSKPIYNPKHRVIDEDGDIVDTRKFFYIEARYTGAASTSALGLLAKQYHNTKWKGCSLRVEEAKPHFLKRLEQEREEREAKAAAAAAVLSADVKEPQSEEDDGSGEKEEAKNEIKNKRRLRIRQRFGAEAFLVDTHPRQIQLGNGSTEGWSDFASLRERMINKRESQRKNLIERRKQERRSWAGGKGNTEPAPPESNDLRSLIFLNRGIHIRFDSIEATDLVSDDSSDVSKGNTEDVTESDESSSSSDSDKSSISGDDQNQKSYMWSDDEDEVDGIANTDDDNNASSDNGEEEEVSNEAADTDDESINKHLSKPTKTNNLRAGAEYTRAVVADEFAFGADDFDFDPSNDDTEGVHSDNLGFDESMDIGLEDDISSNINILSKLFPGDYFESKPLADANNAGNSNGSRDAKEKQKFAAGQIMQRYDPTKDTCTKIEKVETKIIQPEKEIEEDKQEEEQSEAPSPVEDASVSSESTESLSAEEEEAEEEEEKTATKSTETSSKNTVIEESKEDVYEQDELENVFKQSRQQTSTSSAGGFSFGFQVPTEATSGLSNQNTSFTFGFNVSDKPEADKEIDKGPETDKPLVTAEEAEVSVEEKRTPTTERARRVGLTFPESDLDDYEDMFFSLNEGPQILKDLDAMKQDEGNQTQWQKEREQLTSDWKRKQKAAQSRRVKQKRR